MPGQYTGTRGEAQEYISAFIGQGATNSEIVEVLRDYGLGYRQQNMYADINRIRLESFAAEGLKNISVNSPIPETLMREWQGETEYKYRVVVQYEYTSSRGGETVSTASTLYYDEAPSVAMVLEDWDLRVKTLEGGFGSTQDVNRVEGITEINYFLNRPKE
jgi:hypothetical protein